jgi:guanylate kinase
MTFKNHFENIIVNENFETACKEADKIISNFLKN